MIPQKSQPVKGYDKPICLGDDDIYNLVMMIIQYDIIDITIRDKYITIVWHLVWIEHYNG
jgi:hypothetical protein